MADAMSDEDRAPAGGFGAAWLRSGAERPRYWRALFTVETARADDAAVILVRYGALGCAEVGRPGKRRASIAAFFADGARPAPARLVRLLEQAGIRARMANRGRLARLRDPGWAALWARQFVPLNVGRRLLVVAPWQTRVPSSGRVRLIIKPGQAFGTGRDPTTRAMLGAVERLCRSGRVGRALDVGTGSGIVALAAKRLGVQEVIGLDIDPEAVANAGENARLNELAGAVRFSTLSPGRLRRRFDLIAANILTPVLVALAPQLKRLLAPRGRLVLGGILGCEAAAVAAGYRPELRLLERRAWRGWVTLVMGR